MPSPTDDYQNIQIKKLAKRLRELRIQRGYTNYEKFAWDHDISRGQYYRYEKGSDIKFSTLMKVLKALDITPPSFSVRDSTESITIFVILVR